MANTVPDKLARWLIQEWIDRFAKVMESMTGELPRCRFRPEPAPADPENFWWEQGLSLSANAAAWVGAPDSSWKEIGGSVLKASGVDDAGDDNLKSTYQEVLNQSLSGLSQALASRLRRQVDCSGGREARPKAEMPGANPFLCFCVTIEIGGREFSLFAGFSEEVVKALEPADAPKSQEKKARLAESRQPDSGQPKSLDLLLDVELPVSVSFGRAQLALKEVLKLTTGSIVELNRAISEPVEIIVNNCVIARGHVVVVEGNFGVRIQHVISRQERLRTLK